MGALTSLGAEGLLGTCTALDSLELQVWDGHGSDSSTCTRSSLPPGVHCTTRKAIVDGVAHLLSPGTITHGFQVAGFDMEGDSLRRVSRVRLASASGPLLRTHGYRSSSVAQAAKRPSSGW